MHFHIQALKCEQLISKSMVLLSLHNYAYIALFAGVYWILWVRFKRTDARVVWAFLATVIAGALVEIAQGMTARGSCRVRDLAPDAAGALGAALLLAFWSRLRRKPGYVRIVKRGKAAASRPPAPPVAPLRGIPTLPVSPRAALPPTPDFGERVPTFAAPPAELPPTVEVAVNVQRVRATLHRFLPVLRRFGARVWAVIRGRRRAMIVGVAVLLTLVGGAAVVIFLLPAPAPKVVEQPKAAPPPPPRALQSEAEGYYEPSYSFTIGDRQFRRLTLRPQAFLTFARYGGRAESGCADARVGQSAVYLRCEVERVGIVTIDGRFMSRYATSRLDAGVLSASITVTNPRGEVLYRARDSFRWHEPD